MAKVKSVSIESLSDVDVNEMFKFICDKVCMKSVDEVKKLLEIDSDKVNAIDLINLITLFDVKCEIKISYLDATPEAVKTVKQPEPPVSDLHKEMKSQEKAIDPSLVPKFG